MNITFQKFRRLWLLPLCMSSALSALAIEIGGVQYTEQNAYNVTSSSQITLGEEGKNYYYEFTNSTIEMAAGNGAAIEIKGNVAIGVNGYLNVKGGDGLGYKGAGAGIHVPKGSTLTIMPAQGQSSCTVTANGGNAGEPNVIVSNYSIWLQFNNGAGGAGAGIGGNGGNGGNTEGILDSNGNYTNCHYGLPSEACGNIVIEKGVTLTAIGGRGTGVAHDNNGTTVYNFDIVSMANGPINHGYSPAGLSSKHPDTKPSGEKAAYEGSTWSTSNYARGSVGGHGGGGGGYPAAGIGGGGSGGGAGGFGTYASEQSGKATASGHGGNAGGGGSGYGMPGQYGISGGYCKFGFGMERPILVEVGAESKGAGEYLVNSGLYTGRNGYWGQKNFEGKGHAAGQTGSTQLDGVRPGTFLDGGNGGEPVSGSDVKEAGYPGGGVLFDSQCGEIIICGKVKSLGNGGYQPLQFYQIGTGIGVTYEEPNKPYYINDIGTALNGEHNPMTVTVMENVGSLSTNRQDGLTIKNIDANGNAVNEYTVTLNRYDSNSHSTPDNKKIRLSGVRHYKESYGSSALYVSYNGLTPGKERLTTLNPTPGNRDQIHTDGISLGEPYYEDTGYPSADWEYDPGTVLESPSWRTVADPDHQRDYYFNGRVDKSTTEDKLGIFFFNINVAHGYLQVGDSYYNSEDIFHGHGGQAQIMKTNKFQAHYQMSMAGIDNGGFAKINYMSWKPLNFAFTGSGGKNYTLKSVAIGSLPEFENHNNDGSSILGLFTEAPDMSNGYLQIKGQTYSTIEEVAKNSRDSIYVVTWNPSVELVNPAYRDQIHVTIDEGTGAYLPGLNGDNCMMAKLSGYTPQAMPNYVTVKAQLKSGNMHFKYKGNINVAVEGGSTVNLNLNSEDWAVASIQLNSQSTTVKISTSTGNAYVYDFDGIREISEGAIVYDGVEYEIITQPDGDIPGTLRTKAGTCSYPSMELQMGHTIVYANFDLSGEIEIPEYIMVDGHTYIVTEIGDYSLEGKNVTSISLPETLTTIGRSGLRGLTGLSSITIPAGVTNLETCVFAMVSSLKEVIFAEGSNITSIPRGVFTYTNITSIKIPASVKTIGADAFRSCRQLSDVEFVDSDQSITLERSYIFSDANVTNLYIGRTVKGSFTGIKAKNVTYGDLVQSVDAQAFKGCTTLQTVNFGRGVESIGSDAFNGCTGLTELVIPENVTTIDANAFKGCSKLESVVIPSELTSLGESAFTGASNLKHVVYLDDEPVEGAENIFTDYESPTLYAPVSAKEMYQTTSPWSLFNNYVWCGVELNMTEAEFKQGDATLLQATVNVPPTMTQSPVVWTSSDPVIADVDDNGLVSSNSPGQATITATSGPFAANCLVTVTSDTTGIDAIFADGDRQVDVYNLHGVCIKRDATRDDVRALRPGFYIIGGQKLYIQPE